MTTKMAFAARTKLVMSYLRSLRDLEKKTQAQGRGFYRSAAAITASRAASFIMMYNCIEFGLREATLTLRNEIQNSGVEFMNLAPHWREEIIVSRFEDKLKYGTNYRQLLREFAEYMPGVVEWDHPLDRVPFAGNIDHTRLIAFTRKLMPAWKPPRSTLGGNDLDLIRRVRNDLAHGKEHFEAVGALYSTDDLIQKFARTKVFMISVIGVTERYAARKAYKLS